MELTDAINHLKESLADPTHKWGCVECKVEHEQLLEWLEDYKCLLSVSSWIPCNERLPEQYEEVLIYCPGFCEAIKKANFNDGYFHVERSDLAVKAGKFCTHWSPIPQPPKEYK